MKLFDEFKLENQFKLKMFLTIKYEFRHLRLTR